MGRHDYIVCTLVRTGFRSSLKGFNQFCLCVELYVDNSSATIESIYKIVADYCKCTKSSVEKNLRRLFESSDACNILSKLYGVKFTDTGNKEIIAAFAHYIELQREYYIM